jgi:hypothetical protein
MKFLQQNYFLYDPIYKSAFQIENCKIEFSKLNIRHVVSNDTR